MKPVCKDLLTITGCPVHTVKSVRKDLLSITEEVSIYQPIAGPLIQERYDRMETSADQRVFSQQSANWTSG